MFSSLSEIMLLMIMVVSNVLEKWCLKCLDSFLIVNIMLVSGVLNVVVMLVVLLVSRKWVVWCGLWKFSVCLIMYMRLVLMWMVGFLCFIDVLLNRVSMVKLSLLMDIGNDRLCWWNVVLGVFSVVIICGILLLWVGCSMFWVSYVSMVNIVGVSSSGYYGEVL